MNEIELVIPFSLPPDELATDLLRALQLPALSMLLERASSEVDDGMAADAAIAGNAAHDRFARALPYERWLAQRFGLGGGTSQGSASAAAADTSPAIAVALMQALGLQPVPGTWFLLQPVHYHIARDHLVLTDLRRLALAEDDARMLFASARRSFQDAGLELVYGRADAWFVHADRHRDLLTATPDATCGRNIDIWMPQGESARAWRKLQNEVQMDWHDDPVNQRRTDAGLTPVNSLWLWGGATHPDDSRAVGSTPARSGDGARSSAGTPALCNFGGWFAAFGAAAGSACSAGDAGALLTQRAGAAGQDMVLLDGLIGPALAGDWAIWLEALHALEQHWFAPLLGALQAGTTSAVTLRLSHGTRLEHWRTSRAGLRKFWRKPGLQRLAP